MGYRPVVWIYINDLFCHDIPWPYISFNELNYFLSSLIMSLAIVIFGGLLALPIGKRLAKAGTARLTIWRKKQS